MEFNGYIPLREASKKYGKDPSTFIKKMKYEVLPNRNDLIIDRDCIKIGNQWLIRIDRLVEIYGY